MSLFSEKLKQLLQESGQTVYQIAKNAQIDRTTIQRAMTGERIPGISFVEVLCEHLRVSPVEKTELLKYHTIAKIGDTNYATRKYIKTLIEQIAQLHNGGYHTTGISQSISVERPTSQAVVLTGEYQVNSFIRQFLEHAALSREAIFLSVPFQYRYFFDCLLQLYWDSQGDWKIEHLMKLIKHNDTPFYATSNLEALSSVFPFSFCLQNGYRPSYYYQNAPVSQDISVALPYYFFTEGSCVALSLDFKTAILYSDLDIVRIYKDHFQGCIAQSTPLVTNITTSVDMVSAYLDTWQEAGCITHAIEPQPCFARYYTEDMVEAHLRRDVEHREAFKNAVQLIFKRYQNAEEPMESYFTVDGLRCFVETGIMGDLPPQYATPFSLEERKTLLKTMRKEIDCGVISYFAINSTKFATSSATTIQIYKDRRVMFLSVKEGHVVSSLLEEKSIGDAFFDFFGSLAQSGLVYEKEDTIQLIDDCLQRIDLLRAAEASGEK